MNQVFIRIAKTARQIGCHGLTRLIILLTYGKVRNLQRTSRYPIANFKKDHLFLDLDLKQGLANSGLWAKSCLSPVFLS